MARIITKFKYLKPDERNHFGGYAEYIATREGVEKIDESKRNAPATNKQKQLIKKILSDFPDSKSSLEYEDYLKEKTVGAASEFITRALEENADEMLHTKTYADYIATRPRAERFGSHGLFTDDGVAVDLKKVSDELNAHTGNVWTAIVSLRREDAERLGFENGSRWRDMLRSQAQTLSENLRIPMSNLRWFAAFHNESHHPHIHLIAYSTNPNEGYLSEKGVMALRSSFAKDIFAQDLLCEYKKQTEHRDALKVQSREVLAELIAKINGGTYDNPQVEDLLQALAKRLAVTNGKKQYGYLRKDIKEIINNIVDDLGKDERIAALYDLWYESKETALKVYSESQPERLPLSQNKEFKSVKNIVIAEAMKLNLPTDEIEETDEPTEPDREPTVEETESPDPPPPPMDEYEERSQTLIRAINGRSTVRQNSCSTVTATTMIRKRLSSISPNPLSRATPLQNICSENCICVAKMCRNKCSTLCIGWKAPSKTITNTPNTCSARPSSRVWMLNGIPTEPKACCAGPQSKATNMRRTPSARHILTEIFLLKILMKLCAC